MSGEPATRVALVLLSAGDGSRWTAAGGAGHKLLSTTSDGRAVIRRAVEAALHGAALAVAEGAHVTVVGCAVVHGALTRDDFSAGPLRGLDVVLVANPAWQAGQATSLAAAIGWASGVGAEAVVVGLGDQPWITARLWADVLAALGTPGRPIVVPVVAGERAQPVGLRAVCWPLLPTDGDRGARILMHHRPDLVDELPCTERAAAVADVDVPSDLARPGG